MRRLIFVFLFSLFLYPITTKDGFGINYSFLILPLLFLGSRGSVARPPNSQIFSIGLYAVIFVVALFYQYQFYEDVGRRFVSFALFLSMFSYMFVYIDRVMVAAFKNSVLVIGILLSCTSIASFYLLGGGGADSELAKDVVGSQRVGFIYLFGIWILLLDKRIIGLYGKFRYFPMSILFLGLLLTFSRSSIIALSASLFLYALVGVVKWIRRPRLRQMATATFIFLVVTVFLVVAGVTFPTVFDFFSTRLLDYLLNPEVIEADLSNPESSGGTRAYLLSQILEFVLHNPFTGSGFLGVWAIVGDFSGSAHNEYLDILLRTGIPGALVFFYFLTRTLILLNKIDPPLFWGLVGTLFYGIFHETFKEPYGAFMIAFFFGMLAQSRRDIDKAHQVSTQEAPS